MRVLAVEDRQLSLKHLTDVLASAIADSEIFSFGSAEEVIEAGCLGSYDIAFLDIGLPGKDGITLARMLQQENANVNIIFVTAYGEYMADALDMHCSGYVMKPVTLEKVQRELDCLRFPVEEQAREHRLQIRCFGNFEVMVDGVPLHFTRSKAKELLAYLVDRRGSLCSMGEIEAVLWEDESYSASRQSHLRHLFSDLAKAIRDAGVDEKAVLIRRRGFIGINTKEVDCDFFDYLDGHDAGTSAFNGEYMSQYFWAESTLAYLLRSSEA